MNKRLPPVSIKLKALSRNLRNQATPQENRLWYDFLKTQPQRIYRQKVIGNYIVDFYCPSVHLVIESDGAQHYEDAAMKYDKQRTAYLEILGLTVLRFTNGDVNRNFDGVCETILGYLKQAGKSSVTAGP